MNQTFKTHPERINKAGRPPLLFRNIIEQLHTAGIEKVTHTQITDMYTTLLNCDESKLKTLLADKKTPMALRKMIQLMSTDKFLDVMDRMLDRSFGRSKQHIEISEAEAPEPDDKSPSQDELLKKVNERLAQIDSEEIE